MKPFHKRSILSKTAILIGIVFGSIWASVLINEILFGNEPVTLEGIILFSMVVLILLFVIYAIVRSEQIGGIVIIILSLRCVFFRTAQLEEIKF